MGLSTEAPGGTSLLLLLVRACPSSAPAREPRTRGDSASRAGAEARRPHRLVDDGTGVAGGRRAALPVARLRGGARARPAARGVAGRRRIRCSRAATCRARRSPRSSRSTATRRTSPPPNSTDCAATAPRSRCSTAARSRSSTAFHVARARAPARAPSWSIASPILVPDPDTLVVVVLRRPRRAASSAAQSLINAGSVPNKVVSLQGGTQSLAPRRPRSGARTRGRSARHRSARTRRRPRHAIWRSGVAGRFGRRRIDRDMPAGWLDQSRTTYLLDVRTPRANTPPGICRVRFRPQGGQLVQAIDRWVGTRGARLGAGRRWPAPAPMMTATGCPELGWDAVCARRRDWERGHCSRPPHPPPAPAQRHRRSVRPKPRDWIDDGGAAVGRS